MNMNRLNNLIASNVLRTVPKRFFSTATPQQPGKLNVALIQELRKRTGSGMTDCKKALDASGNDVEKAIEWLHKQGTLNSGKFTNRVAAEGVVAISIEGNKGVILEMNCETDFVSRADSFRNLAKKIASATLKDPKITLPENKISEISLENVLSISVPVEEGAAKNAGEEITRVMSILKENVKLRRVSGVKVHNGFVGAYVHGSTNDTVGKMGSIVALTGKAHDDRLRELGKKVGGQVVGFDPKHITKEEVPKEQVSNFRGDVQHLYKDLVLEEQEFVVFDSEGKSSVKDVLSKEGLNVVSFAKYVVGEGLEKKKDDFLEEVMKKSNLGK
eukprot:TRINITY_DN2254_c0_g1_i1.p1 TRINITY_DN2254_c0_g1~~TRINITY_DN2254_c0_g1_i1.p1  ORF type:complete len:330 (+),score=87.95 TRINITY_DN2254_c0_g1_i1:93-1082(+)